MKPIYFDHCSTTPIDPRVLDAMLPYLREMYGNPSTPHQYVGGVANKAVNEAREATADLISCRLNEIIFTSGATESNNLAILGQAGATGSGKRHIVTQVTEHSAVLGPCQHLEKNGWRVTYLPVDQYGQVEIQQLVEAIDDTTSLVSIMWGNNEIGTIQPVKAIAELCHNKGILFHCDAAQAVGKIEVDLADIPISMLTISAHKMYGPKGVGALFIRDVNKQKLLVPSLFGGGQEQGVRPGTTNVPGVVGLGVACSLAKKSIPIWREDLSKLRDRFENAILMSIPNVAINGSTLSRLPHITNLAFAGADNEGLLTMLPELVASTGSACHISDFAPSHVLESLGKKPSISECSLRFGFGKDNTIGEVDIAINLIRDAVALQRVT